MKVFALILSGICLCTLSLGCRRAEQSSASEGEIRVGEFASLTGTTASFGQSSHKGTLLAVEEMNAKGGVLGKQVRLITEDDQSKAGEAATVVRKLISRERIVALLGEVASSRSLEAAPICQQERIPMISPASTNPKVTEGMDYVFRVCFIDPFQGTVLAKFALARGWKRVAILTDTKQDYSVGLSQYFREHFSKNGGVVTAQQSYSSGDKDFKAQLTAIRATNSDAILVSGYYTESGLIARQARELEIKVPLLGGDGWDSPSLVEVGGKAMDGCYFSNHFSVEDPSPTIQDFLARYRKRFQVEPDAMSALGYDSFMVLADAIKRANSTQPEALRAAIAATKDYPGITGVTTINADRNADKPAVIMEIKNGKFMYVETIRP